MSISKSATKAGPCSAAEPAVFALYLDKNIPETENGVSRIATFKFSEALIDNVPAVNTGDRGSFSVTIEESGHGWQDYTYSFDIEDSASSSSPSTFRMNMEVAYSGVGTKTLRVPYEIVTAFHDTTKPFGKTVGEITVVGNDAEVGLRDFSGYSCAPTSFTSIKANYPGELSGSGVTVKKVCHVRYLSNTNVEINPQNDGVGVGTYIAVVRQDDGVIMFDGTTTPTYWTTIFTAEANKCYTVYAYRLLDGRGSGVLTVDRGTSTVRIRKAGDAGYNSIALTSDEYYAGVNAVPVMGVNLGWGDFTSKVCPVDGYCNSTSPDPCNTELREYYGQGGFTSHAKYTFSRNISGVAFSLVSGSGKRKPLYQGSQLVAAGWANPSNTSQTLTSRAMIYGGTITAQGQAVNFTSTHTMSLCSVYFSGGFQTNWGIYDSGDSRTEYIDLGQQPFLRIRHPQWPSGMYKGTNHILHVATRHIVSAAGSNVVSYWAGNGKTFHTATSLASMYPTTEVAAT